MSKNNDFQPTSKLLERINCANTRKSSTLKLVCHQWSITMVLRATCSERLCHANVDEHLIIERIVHRSDCLDVQLVKRKVTNSSEHQTEVLSYKQLFYKCTFILKYHQNSSQTNFDFWKTRFNFVIRFHSIVRWFSNVIR